MLYKNPHSHRELVVNPITGPLQTTYAPDSWRFFFFFWSNRHGANSHSLCSRSVGKCFQHQYHYEELLCQQRAFFQNTNNVHHSTQVLSDYSPNNTNQAIRISYSKDLLLSINTKVTMPSADLLNHLSYLSVNKHRPKKSYGGKRNGRRKQRAIGTCDKKEPTISTPRTPAQEHKCDL